jgi:hypothetical protein
VIHRINQISMKHAAFALTDAGSAPGPIHCRGHVRVRSRYGLVIRNHPSDGVVDRLQSLGFPPPCYPSYEASDSCLGRCEQEGCLGADRRANSLNQPAVGYESLVKFDAELQFMPRKVPQCPNVSTI